MLLLTDIFIPHKYIDVFELSARSILDYQEWGRPQRQKDGSTMLESDSTSKVSLGDWSSTVLRRELDSLDSEMTTMLYNLERSEDVSVEAKLDEVLTFWREKVKNIEERTTYGLQQQMQSQGLATASELKVNIHTMNECLDEVYGANGRSSAFPVDAQKWIYIFMGRMLHKLKKEEDWQIIPFLKGRGGSGKSTVATVIKNFYEASDVGILSNNSERKFGLEGLLDKFVWLCLELKKNITLDQAEFQSMVSGEDMMIARKNQVARQATWDAPGLLCGNEAPSWVDAQGSIARRMAIITFSYSLQERDVVPDLLKRILQNELPALIVKCNQAYRMACEMYRQDDIWKTLPGYFKKERLQFQKDTDAVYAAVFDKKRFELWSEQENPTSAYDTYYVAASVLEEAYRLKWRELMGNSFAEPYTVEKYAQAYQSAGIDGPIHGTRTCPTTHLPMIDMWCIGIREVKPSYDRIGRDP